MRIGIVLPIAERTAGPTGSCRTRPSGTSPWRPRAPGSTRSGCSTTSCSGSTARRRGIHECWTILSAIAEATSRVELGTLVMCTGFRNAALLAKMAATLDHVSGGRLILGIGAGWHDPEYEAFGYPTDHKVGRFEEALAVITGLIRDGRADLDGTYVTARDAVLLPPARPDLPILVAAKGPRMLELTARHADAWNLGLVRAARRAAGAVRGRARGGLRARGARPGDADDHGRHRRSATRSRGRPPSAGTPTTIERVPDRDARGDRRGSAGARGAGRRPRHRRRSTPCTPATVAAFAEAVALFRESPVG